MYKLRIAIIDADLIGREKHRFPNLACMKLSAYYKSKNNDVQLIVDYKDLYHDENIWIQYQTAMNKYIKACKNGRVPQKVNENLYDKMSYCFKKSAFKFDKIIISKVFTDTEIDQDFLTLDFVEYGGTGFFYDKAPPLPENIEHIMPDYHLYDEWVAAKIQEGLKPKEFAYYTDYSIGFTTRGCVRQCNFCVNKNYKQCSLHSNIEEFLDVSRPYICLLDDNVLSCKDWMSIFHNLQATGKRFQFKQGLDERLLTDEKCEELFNKSKWIGEYIFAFDNIKDADVIENKLKLLRRHTNKIPKFYLFCGYNHNNPGSYSEEFWREDIEGLFKRIEILMRYKCLPYIMRYKDYEISPHRGMYITLTRWCNQPAYFKKESLREFVYITDGKQREHKMYASKKYLEEFEALYPHIAKQYYGLKYEKN